MTGNDLSHLNFSGADLTAARLANATLAGTNLSGADLTNADLSQARADGLNLSGAKLARTSNTPGRTRSINFYEVRRAGQPRPELRFADLPGYGYAKVSREISADWARFVDPYLHQRSSLALCLALVDSNIPPQESDGQLMEFLASRGRPHAIVATKCDRLSGNQLRQAMSTLGQAYGGVPIVAFSAKTGAGKEELWSQIRASLSQFPAV